MSRQCPRDSLGSLGRGPATPAPVPRAVGRGEPAWFPIARSEDSESRSPPVPSERRESKGSFDRRTVAFAVIALAVGACGDNAAPVARESCESADCHGVAGFANAIEDPHPMAQLLCTHCHGGDGNSAEADSAHVAPAPQFVADRGGYLKNLSVNELDAVEPAYLQFVNPGDFRVAERTCGSRSPAAGGTSCHQDKVYSTQRSTMATFSGHFNVPRFQAGLQGTDGVFGSRDLTDPLAPNPLPRGTVPALVQSVIPDITAPRDSVQTAVDHYLPKNCTHCHQWSYGRNDARGNYRSGGCTSCHMVYNDDGVSLSSDPSAVREQPPHPERHELTTTIPSNQCEHCHFQGARIGLLYRGVVEWGVAEEPPFPNIGESLHNHPPEFYLQASSDPAHPPDVHFSAGMQCADCHVGRDVHGDGRIYSTAKFQVAIRCENCHGNIDQALEEGRATAALTRDGPDSDCDPTGPADAFLNCNGDPLERVFRKPDGTIALLLRTGEERPVVQVKTLLDIGANPVMTAGMGRDPDTGLSHTEVIECDGCHTAYRQYCYGCHVTMDYSQSKTDMLTGAVTEGAEITTRFTTSLDDYYIGMTERNKIRSFCPSMAVFFSAIDRDDNGDVVELFSNQIRRTATGKPGYNWATDAPHVTSAAPQPCSRCHADESDGCSTDTARATYGFGTGEQIVMDGDGVEYDLTQLLDAEGNPIVDFSHEGQGAVPIDMIERALEVCAP